MKTTRMAYGLVGAFLLGLAGCVSDNDGSAANSASSTPVSDPVTTESTAGLKPGIVKAFLVNGDVQLMDKNGVRQPLVKNASFSEGNTIIVRPASNVTLVFSNGAFVHLKEGAQLKVSKFQQAPFDETTEGSYLTLKRDPSGSTVELNLLDGSMQCLVQGLNTEAHSTFNVTTPAGLASVRGTIFFLNVLRDASGDVTGEIAACAIDHIAFIPASTVPTTMAGTTRTTKNSSVDIGAGGAVVISLTQTNHGGLVAVVSNAGANPSQWQAQVTELYTAINLIHADKNLPPIAGVPTFTPLDGQAVTVGGVHLLMTVKANLEAKTYGALGGSLPLAPGSVITSPILP